MNQTTDYYVYNSGTGVILRAGTCSPTQVAVQALTGEIAVEGFADDSLHYNTGGVRTDRPTFDFDVFSSVPVNVDLVIVAVPVGVTVYADGVELGVTDGTDTEWSSTQPGTYTLRFSKFPYIDKEFQVEVTV